MPLNDKGVPNGYRNWRNIVIARNIKRRPLLISKAGSRMYYESRHGTGRVRAWPPTTRTLLHLCLITLGAPALTCTKTGAWPC